MYFDEACYIHPSELDSLHARCKTMYFNVISSQASNKMYIDNSQIFVDMECERILPGWKPRRLGFLHVHTFHTYILLFKVEVLGERRNQDS